MPAAFVKTVVKSVVVMAPNIPANGNHRRHPHATPIAALIVINAMLRANIVAITDELPARLAISPRRLTFVSSEPEMTRQNGLSTRSKAGDAINIVVVTITRMMLKAGAIV